MSVLIRGMEMPKRGHTTTITIVGSGQAYVEYFDCRPPVKETIKYTAVPVPPHGRLIDADKLKDVQQADADLFKGSSDYGEKCRYDEAINAVANIVNAPTIIPAEEGET